MGWGFLSGLGRGLERASVEPQQYYENVRRAKLDDSTLETQALARALSVAGEMRQQARHPLELKNLQSVLDTADVQRRALETSMGKDIMGALEGRDIVASQAVRDQLAGVGLGDVFGPNGTIAAGPLMQSEITLRDRQGRAAQTSAGASWLNAQTNASGQPAENEYKRAYAKYLESGGAAGGRGAARSRVLDQALRTEKMLRDSMDSQFLTPGSDAYKTAESGIQQRVQQIVQAQGKLEGMSEDEIAAVLNVLAVQNAVGGGGGGPLPQKDRRY